MHRHSFPTLSWLVAWACPPLAPCCTPVHGMACFFHGAGFGCRSAHRQPVLVTPLHTPQSMSASALRHQHPLAALSWRSGHSVPRPFAVASISVLSGHSRARGTGTIPEATTPGRGCTRVWSGQSHPPRHRSMCRCVGCAALFHRVPFSIFSATDCSSHARLCHAGLNP